LERRKIAATQIVFWITAVVLAGLLALRIIPVQDFFAAVDWRLLTLLGSFMLVAEGLKSTEFVEWVAAALTRRAHGLVGLYSLVLASAFTLAMLVTNDAALFAVIPLTFALARRAPLNLRRLVIYEIMAVNLGSAFTPWGNPQNLFIYHHYQLLPATFFQASAPLAAVSSIVLAALMVIGLAHGKKAIPAPSSEAVTPPQVAWGKSAILLGLFALLVLSVMRLLPVYIAAGLLVLYMATADRPGFQRLDWWLLGAFFLLFPTMSGLGELVTRALDGGIASSLGVYGIGIGLSQVISNVPAAMLLSHTTADWRSLFYGVNIGGLGTMVASFANLIGLSLYLNGSRRESGLAFIGEALGWNALALVVLGGVFMLFVW
jgi:Na+/H+ antiporter NhaD/arsenite permease-like protein